MKRDSEYIRNLESTLAQFLKPLKGVPFPVVIKALTQKVVLPFDKDNPGLSMVLSKLVLAAEVAALEANKVGIFTARPNEAGNAIERFVQEALRQSGLVAQKPLIAAGKRKAAGYPDFEVSGQGVVVYLDCKTYAMGKEGQSLRTFFLYPSREPKVIRDGYHLLLAFGMMVESRGSRPCFLPVRWALYDLFELKVQVKHEFNASNRDIYGKLTPLASGEVK